MIDVKDRIIQFPGRYQLVQVVGQEGVYDMVPVTGTVTEEGTGFNRVLVSNILRELGAATAFNSFYANVNAASLDAAFGKGKTNGEIYGIGLALAWYAWDEGANEITYPFTNMITCNSFPDCFDNSSAFAEILATGFYLTPLINASTGYAQGLYSDALADSTKLGKAIATIAGLDPDDYADMSAIVASTTAMDAVAGSAAAKNAIVNNTTAMTAIDTSNMAVGKMAVGFAELNPSTYADMTAVAGNSTAMNAIAGSAAALNFIAKSNTAKTTLIANITAFNAAHDAMVITLNAAPASLFIKTSGSGSLTGSGVPTTVTLGTALSLTNVISTNDTYGSGSYNWTTCKHGHSAVEIIHPAFPTSGVCTINKFGLGGAKLYTPMADSCLSYSGNIYTAV